MDDLTNLVLETTRERVLKQYKSWEAIVKHYLVYVCTMRSEAIIKHYLVYVCTMCSEAIVKHYLVYVCSICSEAMVEH